MVDTVSESSQTWALPAVTAAQVEAGVGKNVNATTISLFSASPWPCEAARRRAVHVAASSTVAVAAGRLGAPAASNLQRLAARIQSAGQPQLVRARASSTHMPAAQPSSP